MILEAILAAIAVGVLMLRTHSRPDPMTKEEVEVMLTKAAKSAPDAKDWRHSIVDLMKILRLDSGSTARLQLAHELGYSGPLDSSAKMNTWLHDEVMKRIADHKMG